MGKKDDIKKLRYIRASEKICRALETDPEKTHFTFSLNDLPYVLTITSPDKIIVIVINESGRTKVELTDRISFMRYKAEYIKDRTILASTENLVTGNIGVPVFPWHKDAFAHAARLMMRKIMPAARPFFSEKPIEKPSPKNS